MTFVILTSIRKLFIFLLQIHFFFIALSCLLKQLVAKPGRKGLKVILPVFYLRRPAVKPRWALP